MLKREPLWMITDFSLHQGNTTFVNSGALSFDIKFIPTIQNIQH